MNDSRPPLSDQELDALFAAARTVHPETSRAEYSFETRLLARLRAESSLGLWSWRLLPWFAAVTLTVGALNYSVLFSDGLPTPSNFAEWVLVRFLPPV